MAEADLGKVRQTEEEFNQKVEEVTGGLRFGQDADGKWGYIVPGEEGADTVIPFSIGGGVEGVELIKQVTTSATTALTKIQIELTKKYKAIVSILSATTTLNSSIYRWQFVVPNESLSYSFFNTNLSGNSSYPAAIRLEMKFDLDMDNYEIGDQYEVSVQTWRANNYGMANTLRVFGIF